MIPVIIATVICKGRRGRRGRVIGRWKRAREERGKSEGRAREERGKSEGGGEESGEEESGEEDNINQIMLIQ
jgi:hypothetical protein